MDTQNITLAVPKKILMKFKEIALHQQKSVSGLMIEMMEEAVNQQEGYKLARDRYLRRLETETNLGTNGNIPWNRDELHER